MAVLQIKWGTADRISQADAVTTPSDGAEAAEGETPRADKPMLVWIQDPTDEEGNAKIQKTVLDPDKLRVGAAYFRCIKVPVDKAAEDPLLADTGKETPRLVLITLDYEVAGVLEGKISSSKLYAAMKKAAKKSYVCNFDKNVKSVIKLLGTLDKIADERKILEQKEERGVKPAQAKKIAKQREELEKEEKEALEKREKLLNPELKTA